MTVERDEAAALAAEAARYEAMIAADVTTLATLCDERLRYVHSNGMVDDRDEWLGKLAAGTFRYVDIANSVDRVTVVGDAAVVHGQLRARGLVGEREVMVRSVTTSVLARASAASGWRLVAFQSTSLPAAATNT